MDSSSTRVQIEKAHNFMRQYRDPESRELKKLSANQFMDVWSHYDKDGMLCSLNCGLHPHSHTHTHILWVMAYF